MDTTRKESGSNRARMAPEIIAQSATPHSNHFNQIEFLHSTALPRSWACCFGAGSGALIGIVVAVPIMMVLKIVADRVEASIPSLH